jgi:hypothetical protein
MLKRFAAKGGAILKVEDISPFVADQHRGGELCLQSLCTPTETVYTPDDGAIGARIGLS